MAKICGNIDRSYIGAKNKNNNKSERWEVLCRLISSKKNEI